MINKSIHCFKAFSEKQRFLLLQGISYPQKIKICSLKVMVKMPALYHIRFRARFVKGLGLG